MNDNNAKKSLNLKLLVRLLKYTASYRFIFYSVLFSSIILSTLSTLRPWLIKISIDDYILVKDFDGLTNIALFILGLLFIETVINFLFSYYANWIGQTIIRDIRKKLFSKLIRFKMSYFDNSSVGVMVTRTVNDMERIADVFKSGFFEIITDVLRMVIVIIVMIVSDWQLSLIVFAILPLLLYATRLFQKAMKIAFTEVRFQVSNLNSFVQERISGMKTVQLFNREDIEYDTFKKINENHKKAWLKTVWYNSIFFPIAELATSVTIGLLVWFGGQKMVDENNPKLGTIIMFVQLSQMLFRPLRNLADKFNTLQMGMIAANRVYDILDTSSQIHDNGTQIAENLKGDILFDKVSFEYVKNQPVIKNISFSINQGETIAIVGATGAGKSTIINLINRFYDVNKGHIYIDGIDVQSFTLASLRLQVAVVLQDVFLFADTIMNNITLENPKIKEEDVIKAAQDIGIYDFIMELPFGFNYNVKERGSMLSAGQKQLIAFLRAYIYTPSILILDEATSSVDNQSEYLIQKATDRVTKGRTSIIIAHRLATIKKASKILVMNSGEIVEEGTHKTLLDKEDSYYKNLYEAQFSREN